MIADLPAPPQLLGYPRTAVTAALGLEDFFDLVVSNLSKPVTYASIRFQFIGSK
jgi:hypothetical protein